MMKVSEIKAWLSLLNDDDSVGIDDGGLALQAFKPDGAYAGLYLEIGGVPGSIWGDETPPT